MTRRAARTCALLAIFLLAGCGALSRTTLAERDLRRADDDAALTELRGRDPLVPSTWLLSAQRQETPQAALDIVLRGLAFHPSQPDLVWARLSLLAHMGRRQEQIDAALATLARAPPSWLEAEVRMFLVDGRLALDDAPAAADEVLKLGGLQGVPAEAMSTTWASVALTYEFLAQPGEADAAFDRSLDSGPSGVITLRGMTVVAPERAASAHRLVERATQRHPDHPDLRLYLVVDRMLGGDAAGAQADLDQLPQPLPGRLWSSVHALRARLDLLQGRVDEALAVLRAQLDASPGDAAALAVFLECKQRTGQPDDAEVLQRLQAARGRVRDPGLAQQVELLIQQKLAPAEAAPTP